MKYQDAYNKIKDFIENDTLGESGTRLISVQKLCKFCGISFVNTLKILRQLKNELYLCAIDQKLYVANGLAKKRSDLRKQIGNSKKIGILVPSFVNPFFAEITEKICEYLSANGYIPNIFLCKTSFETERDALKYFIQNNCEGVLILSPGHNSETIKAYNRFPLPFVVIGKVIDGLNTSYVTSENRSTGALVAKHLIINGYNRFIYIAPKHEHQEGDARFAGFLDGLSDSNQPMEYVHHIHFNSLDSAWKRKLSNYAESLGTNAKIGIFCYHDLIAFETYAYLTNAGFRIPQQIGIIGYDNLEISQIYKLTTCSYSYNEIVKQAFSCLRERIENYNIDNKFIKVQTILLARNSTNLSNSML